MDRALVVVEDTEQHRKMLREAGELAAGVGADLILLSMLTESEYQEMAETVEAIAQAEQTGFGTDTVLEAARRFARDIAREELEGIDVDYEVVGEAIDEGERAEAIVHVGDREGCDHVFITGRRRSPTGKAIFGNTAQSVILNFPGNVTVAME